MKNTAFIAGLAGIFIALNLFFPPTREGKPEVYSCMRRRMEKEEKNEAGDRLRLPAALIALASAALLAFSAL